MIEGTSSTSTPVRPSVPHGSVLGPTFFLFYINDIPDNISSTVRLFADDTIVYIALKPSSNTQILQDDLDKLAELVGGTLENGVPSTYMSSNPYH